MFLLNRLDLWWGDNSISTLTDPRCVLNNGIGVCFIKKSLNEALRELIESTNEALVLAASTISEGWQSLGSYGLRWS